MKGRSAEAQAPRGKCPAESTGDKAIGSAAATSKSNIRAAIGGFPAITDHDCKEDGDSLCKRTADTSTASVALASSVLSEMAPAKEETLAEMVGETSSPPPEKVQTLPLRP